MTKLFYGTLLAAVLAGSASVAQTDQGTPTNSAALANPAVQAALELPRNEPADYVRATLSLLDLGAPELAREVFAELTALELDDAARAKLVNQLGTASLLRLSRRDALGADAAEFVNKTLAAANTQAASPQRLAELLNLLGDSSEAKRRMAVSELAALGTPAVVPLIQLLGDANAQEPKLQAARAALVRLGPLSERPLLATLRSGDARLEAEAAQILAALQSPQAAPSMAARALSASSGSTLERAYAQLTGQSASIESTTGLLQRTLDNLAAGVPAFRPNDAGSVEYWVWGAEPAADPQPRPLMLSAADANLFYQSELASDLATLQPQSPKLQSLALRLAIERSAIANAGEASPLEQLKQLSSSALDRTLNDALKANQVAAAVAALEVIAERRDPAMLATSDGKPSTTATALKHPHPNVRLAALEAIGAIDSPTPFPGASYVCPAIVDLASATGEREVLAASPNLSQASTWAGGLSQQGFAGQLASTGTDALALAKQRADVEMVFVDMAIGKPGVRDVVFQLRRQPETAMLPIGLFAREAQLATARQVESEHERVVAFPRPHDDTALASIANLLSDHLPRGWPTAEQRLAASARAIAVMNKLMTADRNYYRLRAGAEAIARTLRPDRATDNTWAVLSQAGTLESQQALVEFASTASLDIDDRRAAAKAFTESVERFGLRLTTSEISRQYDLYNASELQPKETQEVLGQVLDAIEAPSKAAATK